TGFRFPRAARGISLAARSECSDFPSQRLTNRDLEPLWRLGWLPANCFRYGRRTLDPGAYSRSKTNTLGVIWPALRRVSVKVRPSRESWNRRERWTLPRFFSVYSKARAPMRLPD